jgi:hypothetical protein
LEAEVEPGPSKTKLRAIAMALLLTTK